MATGDKISFTKMFFSMIGFSLLRKSGVLTSMDFLKAQRKCLEIKFSLLKRVKVASKTIVFVESRRVHRSSCGTFLLRNLLFVNSLYRKSIGHGKFKHRKIKNLHFVGTLIRGNITDFSVFHDRTPIRIYEEEIICVGTLIRKT